MSDDKPRDTPPPQAGDETQPVRADGATLPPAPAASDAAASAVAPAQPVERRGFRERLRRVGSADGNRAYGLAALVASALAGVIIGGVGTAVFHAVADDHDRGGWGERHGPMGRDGDDRGERGPMFGGRGGGPGQLQPTTPPEDDDSGTSS